MNVKFSKGKVYALIKEQETTQAEISQKVGVSRVWFYNVMQRGFWSASGVNKIAEALGVAVDEITEA